MATKGVRQTPEAIAARVAGRAGYRHSDATRQRISAGRGGGRRTIKRGYAYLTGMVDHPLAEMGKVPEHRMVLYDAIGPGPHYCQVMHKCDGTEPLIWEGHFGINVDHVDRDTLNNALENLRVACWWCNRNRDNPFHQGV